MTSSFVQRKRILGFFFYDLTRDGVVKQDDFELYGQRVAAQLGLAEGSDGYNRILAGFLGFWEVFGQSADINGDGSISLDEFLASYDVLAALPHAREIMANVNEALFDALDLDQSGAISADEYTLFLRPGGVHPDEAREAFEHLDRNGDGVITRDEFAANMWDYWNAEEPDAAGNWAFGTF